MSATPNSGAVELLSLRFRHKQGPALVSRLEEAAEDCRLPLLDSRLDALDRLRIRFLGVPPVLLLLLFVVIDVVVFDVVGALKTASGRALGLPVTLDPSEFLLVFGEMMGSGSCQCSGAPWSTS